MARPMRRRSTWNVRRKREQWDWVYRSRMVGFPPFNAADTQWTYGPQIRAIASGPAESLAFVLVDSYNYAQARMGLNAASVTTLLRPAAVAEPRRTTVRAVQGQLYAEPSTWALGSFIGLGMRIIKAEQAHTGEALLAATYSMWADLVPDDCATFANQATMLRERRFDTTFAAGQPNAFNLRFGWSGRTTLRPEEGLFLYIELDGTSVDLRTQTWFRSLVKRG